VSDKTWKVHERRIEARLGGWRVGVTGTATPDVVTSQLAVECKHRATLPAWLAGAMAQAVDDAGDLVIVRLVDFEGRLRDRRFRILQGFA
jgi:hypothetical protein